MVQNAAATLLDEKEALAELTIHSGEPTQAGNNWIPLLLNERSGRPQGKPPPSGISPKD